MKDLPLAALLPIMLEAAEMSSDIDEGCEDVEPGQEASEVEFCQLQAENGVARRSPPDDHHRHHGDRRGSLPSERPSGAIRRHLNQLKTRRKTSAPVASTPPKISPAMTNPLANMTGSPLADLLDRLRPRHPSGSETGSSGIGSNSAWTKAGRRRSIDVASTTTSKSAGGSRASPNRRGSADEGVHCEADDHLPQPLFVDTRLANLPNVTAPATVPRHCLYYRQTSMDEPQQYRRPRSNSETGRYLLMRKCVDTIGGGGELVGKLEDGVWAYCQILASMKCSDLMPKLSKIVVFDSNLPIRNAFLALVQNSIRAAPIWDDQRKLLSGILSVTDFMHMLMDYVCGFATPARSCEQLAETSDEISEAANTFETMLDLPLHTRSTVRQRRDSSRSANCHHLNHSIYALADESVAKAAKLLCERRLHRLLVVDPEKGGNPLFLLSKKDVLKALSIYIAKLPLPGCMERTLDDLMIGTWTDLITVSPETSIHDALGLFLNKGLSALPVVNGNYQVLDMLTKVDVMNLIIKTRDPVADILLMTVADATSTREEGVEKMTTCSKKASILLAVECMLHANAHRLAIVNSDGRLRAIVALADLLKFLLSGFAD